MGVHRPIRASRICAMMCIVALDPAMPLICQLKSVNEWTELKNRCWRLMLCTSVTSIKISLTDQSTFGIFSTSIFPGIAIQSPSKARSLFASSTSGFSGDLQKARNAVVVRISKSEIFNEINLLSKARLPHLRVTTSPLLYLYNLTLHFSARTTSVLDDA